MKPLKNIKKSVMEIASLLAQDITLVKLVYNDGVDALDHNIPVSVDLNFLIKNHYISIFPPVENRIEEYGRNTFISILLDTIISSTEPNTRGNLIIYVSTIESELLIKDNRNRLLEICDRIIAVLQGTKLSAVGEINITSISHVMLSEFHTAYRLNLNISDQVTVKGEM